MRTALALLAAAAAAAAPVPAAAFGVAPFVDVETGVAWSGYNDVRVPRDGGTPLSLTRDLRASAAPYVRLRLGATLADRHTVFLFATPLRLEARGTLPREVIFAGRTFAAGSPVLARYRFDSYRLTYRYGLVRSGAVDLDVGATAKIRDAAISLQGATFAEKTDTGFVPLLSFRVAWRFAGPAALVLDGDALAAPQGRAEDVQLALELGVRDGVAVRAGYRIIEGGADVKSVYNFTLVHHVGAGLTVRL